MQRSVAGDQVDPLISLRNAGDAFAEPHLGVRHAAQPLDGHVGELVLLGLHHERVGGLVLQAREVELGDQRAGRPVPELEGARDQADAKVFLDQAELGEHLERRRLGGGGARAVVDALLRLEQRDRMTVARAGQGRHRADRARADDDDVSPLHFSLRLY
jgi:hypothetical protein